MKEVVAIIRVNMVNKTKKALLDLGMPAFFANEAMGRGKGLALEPTQEKHPQGPIEATYRVTESELETGRLFAKRMFSLAVPDDKVESVVKNIIATNQTGNPGDGKVFVLPLLEAVRVRTGEAGERALS